MYPATARSVQYAGRAVALFSCHTEGICTLVYGTPP